MLPLREADAERAAKAEKLAAERSGKETPIGLGFRCGRQNRPF